MATKDSMDLSGPRQPAQAQWPFNGTRFLKLAEVAEFLGVSQTTTRNLIDSGEIRATRTLGGHRRIDARSVHEYAYGEGPSERPQQANGGKLVIYARVSSRKQAKGDESSLDRQIQLLREFCVKGYNQEPDSVLSDVGSGLNFERPAFLNLMSDIVSGAMYGGTVVVKDNSRLCRFGIRLVEFLCEVGGVNLVCAFPGSENENESLATDVLDVLTHFTAKCSGRKARQALKVVLDADSLTRAYKMKVEGLSYRKIALVFEEEGLVDEKGRKFSAGIIRKNLAENWEVLEAGLVSN